MSDHIHVHIDTLDDLHEWLEENHDLGESIWLVKWKKDSGKPYFTYEEMVCELVCFGWIDSIQLKYDQDRSKYRVSPRSPKSNWSRSNKIRIEKLISEGRMRPSGLKAVDIAVENGTWTFLDDVEDLIVPADLQDEFSRHPKSEYYYHRFPDSSKRGILEWIKSAKTEKTRLNRIVETAKKASINRKANHPDGRDAGPM